LGLLHSPWLSVVDHEKMALDPSWSAFATTMPGIGWPDPGHWALGTYNVVCAFGPSVIAQGSFDVVKPLPGTNGLASQLRFYQGPDGGVPAGSRAYASQFDRSALSRLFVELGFESPLGSSWKGTAACGITGPVSNGSVTVPFEANPAWTAFIVSSAGYGTSTPGTWKPGFYGVRCAVGDALIAERTFVVVDR
jgi:hypothetical protein